jgi:hypothetical protein
MMRSFSIDYRHRSFGFLYGKGGRGGWEEDAEAFFEIVPGAKGGVTKASERKAKGKLVRIEDVATEQRSPVAAQRAGDPRRERS